MKKSSEHDFYSQRETLAPCLLFLLQKLLEQVLQHPVNPGQFCSFSLCSKNMTALASVADKSSPDCLDSAIKLSHSFNMNLDMSFLLFKKKEKKSKAGVNAFLAYKILTVSEKGFLMQHYAFDLLENLTGKELVWPLSNPCLCKMLCNTRVTDITAWGTVLWQLSQISLYLERKSRSVL